MAQPQPQADPPGRVGRLANISGNVSVFDHEQGVWSAALPNRPLTSGDRVSTAADARAEIRIGSSVLRLGARTELEALRLDDEAMYFQLLSGTAALRVRTRAAVEEVTLRTPEARFKPMRTGHYRFDRQDDTSFAGSLSGELLVDESESFPIAAGQRMELWRARGQAQLQHRWSALPGDAFMSWASAEDQRDERSAANRYVSPEMTGAEDLDRYGRWDRHPEFGAVWLPLNVQIGWAPFRHGRWVSIRPWGWTWVDEQPWGFAPFHYGRWVQWRGAWVWAPGVYAARPVFAPALVSWVGLPQVGISLSFGSPLPSNHWVPLAPRDVYRPHYVASQRHVELVNDHGWHGRQWRDERHDRYERPTRDARQERSDRSDRRDPAPRTEFNGGPRTGPVPQPTQPSVLAPAPTPVHPSPAATWPHAPAQPGASGATPRPDHHRGHPSSAPITTQAPPVPQAPPTRRDVDGKRQQEDGKGRAGEQRPGHREREQQEQRR